MNLQEAVKTLGVIRLVPRPSIERADPVLNRQELLERVGHDNELLRELVELFREDAPLRLAELNAALKDVSCSPLAAAAHALKGMVSNFATGPAYYTAAILERMGRAGDWSDAAALIAHLELRIQELDAALNDLVHEFST
jgi:two-component system sensor histidine kinase/response regulator